MNATDVFRIGLMGFLIAHAALSGLNIATVTLCNPAARNLMRCGYACNAVVFVVCAWWLMVDGWSCP